MKKKIRKSKDTLKKIVKMDNLSQINFDAAGIDIGSSSIYVCVPEGRDEVSVKKFGTYTCDFQEMAKWLKKCGVTTAAMESTGIYWIAPYEILESEGFKVNLVNAHHVKNVSGRKTDVIDCQWIQQLHTYGLLSGSFHPEKRISEIRSLVRHRENLVRYRASHIQHMQKALHQMNIQLDNVVGDITGNTGMQIMKAIVSGQRDVKKLASYRDYRCKKTEEEIRKSLEGNYKKEYIFQLKQLLELYDYYGNKIKECEKELEEKYKEFPNKEDGEGSNKKVEKEVSKKESEVDIHNELKKICGVDLTEIAGLNVLTVQTIMSEIGVDMSKWKTVSRFTSWLGLCPYNDKTGDKIIKKRTKKTTNRAAKALRIAAQSVHRSQSEIGAFYRRMRVRLGAPKAITATAHKIARIVYTMLKNKTEYKDIGADYYEKQYRERAIKNLKRKAKQLGFELLEAAA
jgi:transposase